jgi:hypothetical protein
MALWEDRILWRCKVCLPVQVTAYDAASQTVSVKPQIQDTYRDQNGDLQSEPLPVASGIPVQFPRGGSMRITFPVAAGDTGIVVCSDRSMDTWLGLTAPQDTAPMDARRHSLQDGVYIPGVNVAGQSWAAADPTTITLGSDTGTPDFVAQASQVTANLDALKSAINSWTPVPNDGGAALKVILTALFASWPSPLASATVKVLG